MTPGVLAVLAVHKEAPPNPDEVSWQVARDLSSLVCVTRCCEITSYKQRIKMQACFSDHLCLGATSMSTVSWNRPFKVLNSYQSKGNKTCSELGYRPVSIVDATNHRTSSHQTYVHINQSHDGPKRPMFVPIPCCSKRFHRSVRRSIFSSSSFDRAKRRIFAELKEPVA